MRSIFFHVLVGHLYVFFGEMSIRVFCPFSIRLLVPLLLSCMSWLYILEIRLLPFFFPPKVSFAVQKLVSLIRSHGFIFAFISVALGDWPKKIFEGWCQRMFCLCSRSMMMSCLTFKSLRHFEFISMHGVNVCSSFIDLHAAVQFSQQHLLKRLFPILYSCLLCQRLIDCRCLCLFLGFLFCTIGLYVCFRTSTTLSWLQWLCNIAWSLGELCVLLGFSSSGLSWQYGFI